MEISNNEIESLFRVWAINPPNKEERARVLKEYREENGITQRKFQEMFGIPKGTLHDWENPETRDQRFTNAERKFSSFILTLKNLSTPDENIEPFIKEIERELSRIKDILQRKKINRGI